MRLLPPRLCEDACFQVVVLQHGVPRLAAAAYAVGQKPPHMHAAVMGRHPHLLHPLPLN